MTKTNKEKKVKASGTLLFRALSNLFDELSKVIKNVQKDMKMTVGHRLMEYMMNSIKVYKKAFVTKDFIEKCEYIDETLNELENIELLLKLLLSSNDIGVAEAARLSSHLGDAMYQLRNWKTSIEKKRKTEDKEIEILND